MQRQVAVIGAGLAGLYACRLLQAANIDFLLLEARDRIGGRILSDDGFDLGPSWFWPAIQPALGALVAELDLGAFAQHAHGDMMFERAAQEPAQRYPGMEQHPQSMRLAGGTAALVRRLADDIPADRLRLGAQVTAMKLENDGVALTVRDAQTVTARQVIAALPPRLLEESLSFTPATADARRWRETPTWMAPHAKFFALYDAPFWREAGLSGTAQSMAGPMTEMHDASTASGAAAIFGFLGWHAKQRAALGEAALTAACLDQLARIFGPQARSPRKTLFKDWAGDPLTATSADAVAGGHIAPDASAWVTGAWAERLALGGSETSPTEPGYLAGALDAARRAVTETLGKLA